MSYVSFGWSGEENKEIKVVVKDSVWMTTHFLDGKPDQQIIRMFGSNELPTPWSDDTDKETVIHELQIRNGHAKVS